MHRSRGFYITFIALSAISLVMAPAHAQTNETKSDSSQPNVVLKTSTNLVVVRTVVRDTHGNPVAGLKKDDFKLFDQGKEQVITHFEEHSFVAPAADGALASGSATAAPSTELPDNFIALYFDELNTTNADMIQARDAADHYFSKHLQPKDRVGIFTSAAMLSDFTSDQKQIHDALFMLHASPRAPGLVKDCPSLTDYQAYEISQTLQYDPNVDAWKIAMDEMRYCSGQQINGSDGAAASIGTSGASIPLAARTAVAISVLATDTILTQAQHVLAQAQVLTRTNLQGLEQTMKATSKMPGRRTVIMVSPGFLVESEQSQLDRLIDRALQLQVVISSLDPKGLAVMMRIVDTAQQYLPTGSLGGAISNMDREREMIADAPMVEVAHGTGGEFFHNNNDLNAGFRALSGSPEYYTLAFDPANLKQDGSFHALKVVLASPQNGINLQARKGYFARKNENEAATVEAVGSSGSSSGSATAPDPAMHEQIREALFAKTDANQLQVKLETKLDAELDAEQREMHQLSVSSHLDGHGFPFRNEGDTSLNTVTFVFGIFDSKENLLNVQQKHVDLVVPEGQMPKFLEAGTSADASFPLKAGTYRLREIVIDSTEHHMTSISRIVKIP